MSFIPLYDRLRSHMPAWQNISPGSTILDWVDNGVPIPFHTDPPITCFKNPKFTLKHYSFIASELDTLLRKGAIELCAHRPRFVSPLFVVPKKGGKLRLIINLKTLNGYIKLSTFKNEDIRTTLDMVSSNDMFTTLDLKDCFYHFRVMESCRDFLGFSFNNKYYRWCVLPFGLNLSPYYCAKIIRPIVVFLRDVFHIRTQCYVDDWIIMSHPGSISDHTDTVVHTLLDLGWIINYEKSSLCPSHHITYIGYDIDCTDPIGPPTLWVSTPRVHKLKRSIRRLLTRKDGFSARALARVTGQCISMSLAVQFGKIMLRRAYDLLRKALTWDTTLFMDEGCSADLNWWLTEMCGPRRRVLIKRTVQAVLYTDASQTGWGAVFQNKKAAGLWTTKMSYMPSNHRELLAVFMAIKTFQPLMQDLAIEVYTDNVTTLAYLNNQGGPLPQYNHITRAILSLTSRSNIHLICHHVRGSSNIVADGLSRISDHHDWRLHPKVFSIIDKHFGPHSVDRFATHRTTHLSRFNSRYFDVNSSAIDCLAQQDWSKEVNYCCPPFALIQRTIDVVISQRATATLVVPWWPGKPWFRLLRQLSVMDPLLIRNSPRIFLPVNRFSVPEPLRNLKWTMSVWKIVGRNVY